MRTDAELVARASVSSRAAGAARSRGRIVSGKLSPEALAEIRKVWMICADSRWVGELFDHRLCGDS